VRALASPKHRITEIDSTGKKTAFVESAATALDFYNLRVVTGRSRELNYRGEFMHHFDVVTARAVAAAAIIVADARNFPNRNGRFILYKTPEQLKTDLPEVRALDKKNPLAWEVTPVFEVAPGVGERQFLYSR
ncbi:MAG: RsmG family class I SAM-dependent methyltransferase, partial [Victivallaceae bacterium]